MRGNRATRRKSPSRGRYHRYAPLLIFLLAALNFSITDAKEIPMKGATETATLGAGCFWCVEALFAELDGVESVASGYSGGTVPNPSYEQVCTGVTGHAEVVQITFVPGVVSYEEILRVFFRVHDPTTPNRQGADSGSQYRSVIFTHSEAQRAAAEKIKREAQRDWGKPVVTQVVPYTNFYKAEGYHQDFYAHNASHPYCRVVIAPKMKKFRNEFGGKLKRN